MLHFLLEEPYVMNRGLDLVGKYLFQLNTESVLIGHWLRLFLSRNPSQLFTVECTCLSVNELIYTYICERSDADTYYACESIRLVLNIR